MVTSAPIALAAAIVAFVSADNSGYAISDSTDNDAIAIARWV